MSSTPTQQTMRTLVCLISIRIAAVRFPDYLKRSMSLPILPIIPAVSCQEVVMRSIAFSLLTVLVFGLRPPFAMGAETRPNILFIVADDLGWSDVAWHGGFGKTPNLDQLARTGVELDRHYVQPVCTPTRTALMSGRYPGRFGPQA